MGNFSSDLIEGDAFSNVPVGTNFAFFAFLSRQDPKGFTANDSLLDSKTVRVLASANTVIMGEFIKPVPYIWHITTPVEWATAQVQGQYMADSLMAEGFIHCSTPAQVVEVANTLFRGRNDLILLHINSSQVQAPIVYEDCYQSGQQFPHIYGPLNLDAVTTVYPFSPDADGQFRLPLAANG